MRVQLHKRVIVMGDFNWALFFQCNFCLVLLQTMQITGIYIIRNSVNGKVYIGSACRCYTHYQYTKAV